MYISVRKISQCNRVWIFVSWALKTKDRQADNPAVTGSTVSCNGNALYHQRRQRCQNDDPLISARKEKYYNNMAENLSKISRTFQSCRFHTEHGCEYLLTHWGLVARITLYIYTSVTRPGRHLFRQWRVAWMAPSHHPHQCWHTVHWTPRRIPRTLETNCDSFHTKKTIKRHLQYCNHLVPASKC